jgi:hypothetical protein
MIGRKFDCPALSYKRLDRTGSFLGINFFMRPPVKPHSKKAPTGKPQKQAWLGPALAWGFVTVAVIGIALLLMNAPREHKLSCSNSGGSSSLIGFGSCKED